MKQLFLWFMLFSFFTTGYSQAKLDSLALQVGFAGNGINRDNEAGTLSLSFHPYLMIDEKWSINLRYDHQIYQAGTREHFHWTQYRYRIRGSDLRYLNFLTFFPTYHFKINTTPVGVGAGFGYYQLSNVPTHHYSFPANKLRDINWSSANKYFGYTLIFNSFFEKFQGNLIINYLNIEKKIKWTDLIISVALNYNILGQQPLSCHASCHSENYTFRKFSIQAGIQPMANFGKYAGAFNLYIEPQFLIKKNTAIGLRINSPSPSPVGFDENPVRYLKKVHSNPDMFQFNTHNSQTMGRVFTQLLTLHYFIQKNKKSYFYNAGIGIYHKKAETPLNVFNLEQDPLILENNKNKKNIGGFLGAGIKNKSFRYSLEYNFSGKHIPDYLAVQVGVDIGIGKSKILN